MYRRIVLWGGLILIVALSLAACTPEQAQGTSQASISTQSGVVIAAADTDTPSASLTPAFTPTATFPPPAYIDLFIFKKDILNTYAPTSLEVTGECGMYQQCTKDFVYTLTGPLKGNYYKYHLLSNPAVLNLRVLFSPYGSQKKTLLAEWREQVGLDGAVVGQPFDGKYGDRIILEIDLPGSPSVALTEAYAGRAATISIGSSDALPLEQPSTPVPPAADWKNVTLTYLKAGQPIAKRMVWYGFRFKDNWVVFNAATDGEGKLAFRVPLMDTGESCLFIFGNSMTQMIMDDMNSSASQGLLYYRTPASFTGTDLAFQVDENGKVTLLPEGVDVLQP
ncbi:MAG TPA: hypothetical protein VMC09_12520 [Anaerolineales bacterium]|nr:hypothetical protein [Anaerolineales bacterium]